MPPIAQQPFCKTCGETDPLKFKGRCKGLCYECQKKWSRNYYASGKRLTKACLCQGCGTTDPQNFFPNGGSLCKRCLYPIKKQPPKFVCKQCGKAGKEHFYYGNARLCTECRNRKQTESIYPFYQTLVKIQGGEFCAVCHRSPQEDSAWRLTVDHDHDTGFVRGLLCSRCNRNAGVFNSKTALQLHHYLSTPPALHLEIQLPEKLKKKYLKSQQV